MLLESSQPCAQSLACPLALEPGINYLTSLSLSPLYKKEIRTPASKSRALMRTGDRTGLMPGTVMTHCSYSRVLATIITAVGRLTRETEPPEM